MRKNSIRFKIKNQGYDGIMFDIEIADDDVGMHTKTAKQTGSLSLSTGANTNKKVSLSFSTGAAPSEKLFQESDAESVASGSEESDNLK